MRTSCVGLLGLILAFPACSGAGGDGVGETHAGGSAGFSSGGANSGGAAGSASGGVAGTSVAGAGGSTSGGSAGMGDVGGSAGTGGGTAVLDCTPAAPRACDDRALKATTQGVCDGDWCWENPVPYGIIVRDVSAAARDDVWAVSDSHVLHYDGSSWSIVRSLPAQGISIYASGANSVWVSAGQIAHHFDGQSWSETDLGEYVGYLDGTSPTNVWASLKGITHHFDGQSWQTIANPVASSQISFAVAGDDDIWVTDPYALHHYVSGTWSSEPFPGGAAIAVVAPDDVWFASGSQSKHYTGAGFVDNPLPTGQGFKHAWASASEGLWLLSSSGKLHHWDGNQLTTTAAELDTYPEAFAGTSAQDQWAVGQGGMLAHFSGTAWSKQTRLEGDQPRFSRAVHGSAANDVWVVGEQLAAHFDGTHWALHDPGADTLYSVWVDSPTSAYAASATEVRHWDGTAWTSLTPIPHAMERLQSLGDGRLWMATASGSDVLVYHYRDAVLSEYQVTLPSQTSPKALWANSDCDVWVGGNGLSHFDGTLWATVSIPGVDYPPPITGLYGRGANDVWVSTATQLFHFDGTNWEPRAAAPGADAMWGCDDTLFTQSGSVVSRFNGSWTQYPAGPLQGKVWSAGAGSLLQTVGNSLQLVRYSPTDTQ